MTASPSTDEIDAFLEKASVLERTVRGISDGSIADPSSVSLREYGILTPEEARQEEEQRKNQVEKRERAMEEEERVEKERERRKWWEGVDFLFGSYDGSSLSTKDVDRVIRKQAREGEAKEKNIRRYGSDYSHWSPSSYVPDDDATREEEAQTQKELEMTKSAAFQKANQEWCNEYTKDAAEREETAAKRSTDANKLRVKGNAAVKKKKYAEALKQYALALEMTPYAIPLLCNVAIAYGKTNSWHDSLEFSNRVLRIDESNAKALYHRGRAYVALGRLHDAKGDIDRCVILDPKELLFRDYQTELGRRIEGARLENILCGVGRCGTDNSKGDKDGDTDGGNATPQQRVTTEDLEFTVTAALEGGDVTAVEKQCRMIDLCVESFRTNNHDDDNPGGMEMGGTMFCQKIRNCAVAGTYMRISGHLKDAADAFVRYVQKSSFSEDLDFVTVTATNGATVDWGGTILVLDVMAAVVGKDPLSYNIIRESGALALVVRSLFSSHAEDNEDNNKDNESSETTVHRCASELSLLAMCVDAVGVRTAVADRTVFRNAAEFVVNLCQKIGCWSGNQLSPSVLPRAISIGADVVSTLADCDRVRKQIQSQQNMSGEVPWNEDKNNPVVNLANALRISYFSVVLSKSLNSTALSVATISSRRRSVVRALQALSTIEELRPSFAFMLRTDGGEKLVTTVHVLLAVAKSFMLEAAGTAEMALIALRNAATTTKTKTMEESNGNRSSECTISAVGTLIASCGGVGILVDLCRSSGCSTPALKLRAAALLDHILLVSGGTLELTEEQTEEVWIEYKRVVDGKEVAGGNTGISTEHNVVFAGVLVRIVALSIAWIDWSDPTRAQTLMQMMPDPQTDTSGEVTAESVCLPPYRLANGTPVNLCPLAMPSLYCNVLKVVINYLDASPILHLKYLVQENGIETFVCLLANAGRMHPSVAKNAAAVLARVMKGDKVVQMRCRELRGMEILTELGQTGKV